MNLDVGCGGRPRGDINCDVSMEWNPHLLDQKRDYYVDIKKIPNFVRCDAHYLPFIDEQFENVFCTHVIEHCVNPIKVLDELIRVASNHILVIVPHRYARGAKKPHHINFFDVGWFLRVLSKRPVTFDIGIRVEYFLNLPFLSRPLEILANLWKKHPLTK